MMQEKGEHVAGALKEEPNFLAVKYNENKKADNPTRAGGVYVPPHKLRAMQEQMLEEENTNSLNYQKLMWELLRKSINGIVNKVNIANIQNVVVQLFNENILRGKGLLARSIIKAQMASPNFTHVYAALIAVINTKLPEIGELIIHRVLLLFRNSYSRNNKLVCMATTKMIAHLINQRIVGEYVGLQILMMMLLQPSEDSVEIACDFMVEVGQVFSEVTPQCANVVFERFKNILHEGEMAQKAQYSIENLFAIRKTGFKDHPGVIPELDLVELEDQITHQVDIDETELNQQRNLNIFREDKNYAKTEEQWEEIKKQILGEENIIELKQMRNYEEEIEEYEEPEEQGIKDLTEQDLINLRRTIYLAIQSTVNFEQCAHKILKMNIAKGYQMELIDMIIECCMMERIYQNFFGLLSERFCKIDDKYKELFIQAFVKHYNSIFKMEANKIRNLGHLFGHLFYSYSIDWKIFEVVILRQDTTTAAHRMFLKILFREIAQNLGIEKMAAEFKDQNMRPYFTGLFPINHPNDVRFAINYFTSIGLGKLTEQMRQVLAIQEEMIAERRNKEEQQRLRKLMEEEQQMLKLEEMARQQERQKEREREKQRQEERKKQKQKQRQKQREREREREREKQKYKQRQRQRQKQKQRKRQRQRQNQLLRQAEKQRNREKYEEKHRKRRSPSSSSSSSSSSDSESNSSSSTPEVKKTSNQKRRRVQSQESQSSGIQSSDSEVVRRKRESSDSSRKERRNIHRRKKYSESSSSSNSSSSSPPRRRDRSRSREKLKQYNKRKQFSSSTPERRNYRRRR